MGRDSGLAMSNEPVVHTGNLEAALAAAQEFNNTLAGAIMEVVQTVNLAKHDLGQERLQAMVAILSAKNQALAEIRGAVGARSYGVDTNPNINNRERRSIHTPQPTEY
jgi:hypothetical protein